jgi:hypothetical protein
MGYAADRDMLRATTRYDQAGTLLAGIAASGVTL